MSLVKETKAHLRVVLIMMVILNMVDGHAKMTEPPMRSSMWRFGYDTPVNYNDNELFCGGIQVSTRDRSPVKRPKPWVDPEGGQGVRTPLKNHKNIGFLSKKSILVLIP